MRGRKGNLEPIFVDRGGSLSRRDYRSQPGVLTPGIRKKRIRPEGAADCYDRRLVYLRRQSRGTGSTAPTGRAPFFGNPGVKTPGLVLSSLWD